MAPSCRSGSPPKLESVFLLFVVVTVGQIMTGRRLLQSLSGSPLWLTYSLRSTLWINYGNLPKKLLASSEILLHSCSVQLNKLPKEEENYWKHFTVRFKVSDWKMLLQKIQASGPTETGDRDNCDPKAGRFQVYHVIF